MSSRTETVERRGQALARAHHRKQLAEIDRREQLAARDAG